MSWYVMEEPDIVFVTHKEARDYAGVLRTVGEYSCTAPAPEDREQMNTYGRATTSISL